MKEENKKVDKKGTDKKEELKEILVVDLNGPAIVTIRVDLDSSYRPTNFIGF